MEASRIKKTFSLILWAFMFIVFTYVFIKSVTLLLSLLAVIMAIFSALAFANEIYGVMWKTLDILRLLAAIIFALDCFTQQYIFLGVVFTCVFLYYTYVYIKQSHEERYHAES